METLVCTRGRGFPLSRLETRTRLAKIGVHTIGQLANLPGWSRASSRSRGGREVDSARVES
jgi:hypothetical protein